MNIIAVIPARGGSKGVPQKNIRMLGSKPLVAHTIEQALAAKSVQSVFVTTDCQRIASVSSSFGASIVMRPNSISSDTASSEAALLHALDTVETQRPIDYIVFLQCTSPFRRRDDIDNAVNLIVNERADSLLSVVPSHRFIWSLVDGKATSINYDYRQRPRRQDMPLQYMENGSIYVFKPSVLTVYKNRLGGRVVLYPMDEVSAIDIDSEQDLLVAETLIKAGLDPEYAV